MEYKITIMVGLVSVLLLFNAIKDTLSYQNAINPDWEFTYVAFAFFNGVGALISAVILGARLA